MARHAHRQLTRVPCSAAAPRRPAGLWATLQFKWIQLQYPAVVLAFEKILVAGCLPAAGAVQTWGLAAGVGMASAPFFMAPLLCTLYYSLALPLPSSFHLGPRRTSVGAFG